MNVTKQVLDNIVETLVVEIQPERIYLFGSHAEGSAQPDSDLDLLIVESEDFGSARNRWRELQRIRRTLAPYRVPKDILVYSRREFDRFHRSLNHVAARVAQEGRLLYERP